MLVPWLVHSNDEDKTLPFIEATHLVRPMSLFNRNSGRPQPAQTRSSDCLVRYSPAVFLRPSVSLIFR